MIDIETFFETMGAGALLIIIVGIIITIAPLITMYYCTKISNQIEEAINRMMILEDNQEKEIELLKYQIQKKQNK